MDKVGKALLLVLLCSGGAADVFACHYDVGTGIVPMEAGSPPGSSAGGSAAGGASGASVAPNGGAAGNVMGTGTDGTIGAAGSGGQGTGGDSAPSTGGTPPGTGDAATARWCAGKQVLLCEDFDGFRSIDDFMNTWTVSTTGGTFSFDTNSPPSPPHALRVRTNAAAGVTALAIRELPAFSKPPSKVRLEFDFRIDAGDRVDLTAGAIFAGIMIGNRVTDGIAGIDISQGPMLLGGYLEPSGPFAFMEFPIPIALFPTEKKWAGRYAFEIGYSSGSQGTRTGCAQILREGVPQLDQCFAVPTSLAGPLPVSVVLGVYSGGVGLTNDIVLGFDDVTVTAE